MTSMSTGSPKNGSSLWCKAEFLIPHSLTQTCSYLTRSYTANGSTVHQFAQARDSELSLTALSPHPQYPVYQQSLSPLPSKYLLDLPTFQKLPTSTPTVKATSIIHLGHSKRMTSLLLLFLRGHFLYKQVFLKDYQITAPLPCFPHLE